MQRHSYLLHWIYEGQRFEMRKINIANPLHIIVSKVNGYFTEIIGNKYLTLVPSKEKVKKNWKLGTKSEI